jgi:hypothetical protein
MQRYGISLEPAGGLFHFPNEGLSSYPDFLISFYSRNSQGGTKQVAHWNTMAHMQFNRPKKRAIGNSGFVLPFTL